jgi:PTH1 family peptidyl-tRNA hydrolase
VGERPSGPSGSDSSSGLLLVGLGNPGREYARSRHNLGWLCLEALARRVSIDVSRKRWRSLAGSGAVEGRTVWLLRPQTYMNLSGRAVAEACRDLGLDASSVWVVYDELDLPFCRLRIRRGGSAAGHNGVRSLIGALGSDAFVRFRVGVGKPPAAGSPAGVRHVLGRFTRAEAAALDSVIDGVASALETGLRSGLERAMELYNRAGSLGCSGLP